MFKAETYVGHKVARPRDVVINTMWAWMGALGVSSHVGLVSPSYGVYRPLNDRDYLPDFLDYLLRIPPLRWEYTCRSTGIRASRLRLYPDKFLDIVFPCPPREEQRQIAAFLRAKDAQIRRLMGHKRKLIHLASERLNIVTCQVVSSYKTDEHRLEIVAQFMDRPVQRIRSEYYTQVGLYNRGRGIFHKQKILGEHLGDSEFFWVQPGDLIISGQFAWEGSVGLAEDRDHGCIASHRYPILRGVEGLVDTAYLFAFFRSDCGHLLLDVHSRGAAGRNRPLNVASFRKERIPVPPTEVQAKVRRFVELEAAVRRQIRAELEKILEYRERLITDVVTGKMDVRHVKITTLPEEQEIDDTEEPETEDEMTGEELMEEADAAE